MDECAVTDASSEAMRTCSFICCAEQEQQDEK